MPDLLLEIGVEELPASYIEPALLQLRELLEKQVPCLNGLAFQNCATPRRLAVYWENVPEHLPGETREVKGPPVAACYGPDGKATPALAGFLAKNGAGEDAVEVRSVGGRDYCYIIVHEPGRPTAGLLAAETPGIIDRISFPKKMRWNDPHKYFARPIRSICCLLGSEVVPFEWNGVKSGRTVHGHAMVSPAGFELEAACLDRYRIELDNRKVVADQGNRDAQLIGEMTSLCEEQGLELREDLELEEEVKYHLEFPNAIIGNLDAKFMVLPEVVLAAALRHHQFSFLAYDQQGRVAPVFLSACNIPGDQSELEAVRRGNENVCRARLQDALFFYNEDRTKTLADRVDGLKDVVFHQKLGSYHAKTLRVQKLCSLLADMFKVNAEERASLDRAAYLSRADLLTAMVYEFPELQGKIGRVYAELDGEGAKVAQAIEEMYMPVSRDAAWPRSRIGALLSLADRADSLCAFFTAGLKPTASKDPFGLRRHAIALIKVLSRDERCVGLTPVLKTAIAQVASAVAWKVDEKAVLGDVRAFLLERLWNEMLDREPHDLCDAVHAVTCAPGSPLDIRDAFERLAALSSISGRPGFQQLCTTLERAANITKDAAPACEPNSALASEAAEIALFEAWNASRDEISRQLSHKTQDGYANAASLYLDAFSEPLDRFFTEVFVNVPDESVRMNRLALLRGIYQLLAGSFADLTRVVKKGSESRQA